MDPALLDGDLPVSVREWQRAVKGYRRRAGIAQFLLLLLPVLLFLSGALWMFRQLTVKLEAVIVVGLEQRLPRNAGPGVDRLLAVFDLAAEVARAHWWSVALITAAVLALAVALWSFMAFLTRLALAVNPRTRADLRVHQRLTGVQFRTLMPALWTASGLYFVWIVWTATTALRDRAELDYDRLISSSSVLIVVLLLLVVCSYAAMVAATLRRHEIPREHLLRWLGRSLSSLLASGLVLPTALFVFGSVFPRQVVPAVDRAVLSHLDTRILEVSRSHGLAALDETRRVIRDLPLRLQLEKAPWVEEMMSEAPLRRFFHTAVVAWLAAVTLMQPLLAWLARGPSRWVWSVAALVGVGLLLAIVTGRLEPVFGGDAGVVSITAYVVLGCAAMTADVLLNPANSPWRAAADPVELALARVRLQEGGQAGGEDVERARRTYEGVGCALDGSLRRIDSP